MQKFLLKNAWWLVAVVSVLLFLSHTFGLKGIKVDSTSLVLLGIFLFSPFLAALKKIKIGDFEAEIDPGEIRRLQDQVEANVPNARDPQQVDRTLPEAAEATANIAELVKSDPVMALAKLRIELEKILRKIYAVGHTRQPGIRPLSLGHIIQTLAMEENLLPGVFSPLREVVALCNRAVHGEEIRPQDAVSIVDMGTSLLVSLYDQLAHFAPAPTESQPSSQDEVQALLTSTFRVVTMVPDNEQPRRSTYYVSKQGLDQFLESRIESTEFLIEVTPIP